MKNITHRNITAIIVTLAAVWSGRTVQADTFNLSPVCDLTWQSCCDCGVSDRCINWDVLPMAAPACPDFPTRLDDVIISFACQIDPLPFQDAVAGSITQSGGNFLLDGTLVVDTTAVFDGLFIWQSGSLLRAQDPGVIITLNGGMNIIGSAGKNFGTDGLLFGGIRLLNNATITWTDSGNLTLGDIAAGDRPSVITNSSGSLIDAQSNASILDTAFGAGRIDNDGTIQKSAGDGISDWNVELVNNGVVHVQNGELHLTGGGHSDGEFIMEAGTRLAFASSSPFEFLPGIVFNGDGEAVLLDTGLDSGVDIRQTVQLNRFSVEDSGQIGPTLAAEFGVIEVTGRLNLSGASVFPPIHVLENAILAVSGPNASIVGDLTVAGTANIDGAQLASSEHAIIIDATGIVELGDNGSLSSSGVAGLPILNAGIVRKTTGAGVSDVVAEADVAFENSVDATIDAASGLLSFDMDINSDGTIHVGDGAILRALREVNLFDGTLSGSGTLVAHVNVVGATVAPGDSAGLLTIASSETPLVEGSYTQGADATLAIEVGGLDAGTTHDALDIEDTATLDGTLKLTLIDGFVPHDGDTIAIITAGSVSGEFSDIDATNLPDGVTMDVVYSNSMVVVEFSVASDNNNNNNSNDNDNNNNDNDNSNNNNANTNTNDNSNNNNSNSNDNANNNNDDGPGPDVVPDCGNGACGANTAALLPFMLAGLGARAIRNVRRRRNRRS